MQFPTCQAHWTFPYPRPFKDLASCKEAKAFFHKIIGCSHQIDLTIIRTNKPEISFRNLSPLQAYCVTQCLDHLKASTRHCLEKCKAAAFLAQLNKR